jgi:hypothetical protein
VRPFADGEASPGASFEPSPRGATGGVLVLACGAIAREVRAVIRLNAWTHVTLRCLPAALHNAPAEIAPRVDDVLRGAAEEGFADVFVAYGDCGTGGALDRVLARRGAERLAGAHCYAFLAGVDAFAAMHEADPASFYLTDFLCRHFDRLVVQGLGIDAHPELLPVYFGNYRRLVYLAQTDDPDLVGRARRAADRLGLALEVRGPGLGDLAPTLEALVRRREAAGAG